jgi:glutamate dehydrogenase
MSADKVLPLDKPMQPKQSRDRDGGGGVPVSERKADAARAALLGRADAQLLSEPSFSRFLRAVAEALADEDIATADLPRLEARMRASYARMGTRDIARNFVSIVGPEGRGEPEIVNVFSPDTPFIVDSVLGAIRANGGRVRMLVHPVIDFDPTTFRVLEEAVPGSRRESFLHVEIDPLPGTETRSAMSAEIELTLTDVARATAGWRPMLRRLHQAVGDWQATPPPIDPDRLAEAVQFLGWLAEHNFTFLGMREYRLEGDGAGAVLVPAADSELGILEDASVKFLRSGTEMVEMTDQHRAFLADPSPLLVTKANMRARVHRRAYMDYVGVKLYTAAGAISGELRILGLFTSLSFATPNLDIPLLRGKVLNVLDRAGFDRGSHAGKALMNVLDTYPREELFQIDEGQLSQFAVAIAELADRPRVRVLPRIDRFDNFVSALVYVPRDRYDTMARIRIGDLLAREYDGHVSAFSPYFPEGELVRVHFIIGRKGGPTPRPARADLEARIALVIETFADRLLRAAAEPARVAPYLAAFPPAYAEATRPETALADIEQLKMLPPEGQIALRFAPRPEGLGLRVFHRKRPIALSDRVPMLEHFGFRIIDESTYRLTPEGDEVYLHDMLLSAPDGADLSAEDRIARLDTAVLAVWRQDAESDALNALTTLAGLGWADVEILRAMVRYDRQLGLGLGLDTVGSILARYRQVALSLVRLFHARHDPYFAAQRERAAAAADETIRAGIAATVTLDEDRVLRRLANLVEAVVRTNAYQRDASGTRRPALALKFDCSKIEALPEPRPYREIFVYCPRVEGLHLRFGPIARGGLRWSDRPDDFRTEVLGLVKAQQVKNAIIVPVGAKGAFVPRGLKPGMAREAREAEGIACYKIFISSLLDLTDTYEGSGVLPPPDLVRRDGDDPYLVVAADKGTASFSDIANAIATSRGFWLGDAFASGGSAGYDHKQMGITARGAWLAVERHFREMGRNSRTDPFTVVGVGDMSGDVFGNGLLLARNARLVAAFDHRDIFIDPNPDQDKGFAERQRLFGLERSSWQDYDKSLLSTGGGVFSRALKSIELSTEARAALGVATAALTPTELIRAILSAPVDLLWFGGIGTYVRAAEETDAEVGDRGNDAVRVTATDLQARIVGEGANLAVTQKARIAYALRAGRINTDAIDNSAGVNSSDLEVNIKIALGAAIRQGKLALAERNALMVEMTQEVAALCLENNRLQSEALSLETHRGLSAFGEHLGLMAALEASAGLSRKVEALPDDASLRARADKGQGLTRPELAVLLAYAKNELNTRLVACAAPDDPYLGRDLPKYFPALLAERQPETITHHRLRREVIATVLANGMLNRGGPAFVQVLEAETGADIGRIAASYAACRDIFDLTRLHGLVDGLDGTVPAEVQLDLALELQGLLRRQSLWLIRHADLKDGLTPLANRFRNVAAMLEGADPRVLGETTAQALGRWQADYAARGLPEALAQSFARLKILRFALEVGLVAEATGARPGEAATVFFSLMDLFSLAGVIEAGEQVPVKGRLEQLAKARALIDISGGLRRLVAEALSGDAPIGARFEAWRNRRQEELKQAAREIRSLAAEPSSLAGLAVMAGLVQDLVDG